MRHTTLTMDIWVKVSSGTGRDAFSLQYHFAADRNTVVAAVIGTGHFTADHVALDDIFIHLIFGKSCDQLSVAQDGQCIAFGHQFVQIVGNEDDGLVLFFHPVHDAVYDLTALLGKRCRRFIDDQHFRPAVNDLGDLDQFAVLHAQRLDRHGGIHTCKTDGIQCLFRFGIHFCLADDRSFCKL